MATSSENVIGIKLQVGGAQALANHFRQSAEAMKRFNAEIQNGSAALNQWAQLAASAFSVAVLRRLNQAAEESAVAVAQLAQAVKTSGQASQIAVGELVAQANALQDLTGVSDESTLAVSRMLLQAKATADEVRALTPLVLDLSVALGNDATAAAGMVARALDGDTISLGKLNISARNTRDLIAQLQRQVGGQAAAVYDARGAWASLATQFGELQEEAGRFLRAVTGDAIRQLAGGIRGLTEALNQFRENHRPFMDFLANLGGAAGYTAVANGKLLALALSGVGLAILSSGLAKIGPLVLNPLRGLFVLLTGSNFAAALVQARALFDILKTNPTGLITLLGAGTRAATVIAGMAAAVAGLAVGMAGFTVGTFVSQIKLAGVAVDEWLAHALLRATYAFQSFFGIISDDEYRANLEALRVQLADIKNAAEAVAAVPPPPLPEVAGSFRAPGRVDDPAFAILNAQRLLDIDIERAALQGAALERFRTINPLLDQQTQLAGEQVELAREALRIAQDDYDSWRKSAAMMADNEDHRAKALLLENALRKARQDSMTAETVQQAELLRIERDRLRLREELLGATYAGATQQQFDAFQNSKAAEEATGLGGMGPGAIAGMQEALIQIGTLAQQTGRAMTTFIGSAISGISDGIKGLIKGTLTWGQALANIGGAIMDGIIDAIARMFAEWIVGMVLKSTVARTTAAAETAAKAPVALLDSISSFGIAAAVGGAAFLAAMALAGGFEGGGYTGNMAPNQPAGLVHGREYVFNAPSTARLGREDLDALQRGQASIARPGQGGGGSTTVNFASFDTRLDARKWANSVEGDTWFVDSARRTAHRWSRS